MVSWCRTEIIWDLFCVTCYIERIDRCASSLMTMLLDKCQRTEMVGEWRDVPVDVGDDWIDGCVHPRRTPAATHRWATGPTWHFLDCLEDFALSFDFFSPHFPSTTSFTHTTVSVLGCFAGRFKSRSCVSCMGLRIFIESYPRWARESTKFFLNNGKMWITIDIFLHAHNHLKNESDLRKIFLN